MYNFNKGAARIIEAGRNYGVTIARNPQTNAVYFVTPGFRGSKSVNNYLSRIMRTYNNHVAKGF